MQNKQVERPWWAIISMLFFLFPVGVLFLIKKVSEEKREILKNGRMLIIFGAISAFFGVLGMALTVYAVATGDEGAAPLFGVPALALLLFGAAIIIWGVMLRRKGMEYNRYLRFLLLSSERSIPSIAQVMGVNTMRALEMLEMLVDYQYIRGMYVDHGELMLKSKETAKFAIRCKHCGGTSILEAGKPVVCEYCGAAL